MCKDDSLAIRSDQIAPKNETSIAAMAAQQRATVEAKFLVALNRMRDVDVFREKILKDCNRPRFAEVARYKKPKGYKKDGTRNYIEGPSIRFAEAAARAFGNLDIQTPVIFDDDEQRIIGVAVTDLESNISYSQDIAIKKIVERKKLGKGQKPLSVRTNSYGQSVYLVQATEDDFLDKQNAAISKAVRNCVLRLLPGDIVEEAMDAIQTTQAKQDKEDPDAARKRLLDSFTRLGVPIDELKEVAGHDLKTISPTELETLRGYFSALKNGEASWTSILLEHRNGKATTEEPEIDPITGEVVPPPTKLPPKGKQ